MKHEFTMLLNKQKKIWKSITATSIIYNLFIITLFFIQNHYFMRKNFCIVIAMLICLGAVAEDKKWKAVPTKATVFFNGAQLFHEQALLIPAGTTTFIFEDISPTIVPNSVQVAGKGNFVILDSRYNLEYKEANKQIATTDSRYLKYTQQIALVQDSLDDLLFLIKENSYKTTNFDTEKMLLTNSKMMVGPSKSDSLAYLRGALDFARERLNNIDEELLKLEKIKFKLSKKETALRARIAELNLLRSGQEATPQNPYSHQIIVTVSAEVASNAVLFFNYFTNNCGWIPNYEIHANSVSNNVELKHKAQVQNNTGIEWKEIELTLSTGNPSHSNTKPTLTPLYLSYTAYLNYEYTQNAALKKETKDGDLRYEERPKSNDYKNLQAAGSSSQFTSVAENMIRTTYNIKLKYTIKADGKPHNVAIQDKKIDASLHYAVAPRLDVNVFLMAYLTNWEDLNLVPGQARIYFDNSYVGETFVNPVSTNDTLAINLGRDESIVVTRTKIKHSCKEKLIGDTKIVSKAYEIVVRNTKNIPIVIDIEDQLPITKEVTIKIENTEYPDATLDEITGILKWQKTIKPKETQKVNFSFDVKHPKDKVVVNL